MSFSYESGGAIAHPESCDRVFQTPYYPSDDFCKRSIAYGRTKASKPHLQDAMRLLSRLSEFTKAGGRTIRTMETLMLQALAWQAWGDGERAIACFKQALDIPRQGDYIRLFVDEGQPMAQLLRHAASKNIYSRLQVDRVHSSQYMNR
jgi:tetratricopeptide (TPR) repeat protein